MKNLNDNYKSHPICCLIENKELDRYIFWEGHKKFDFMPIERVKNVRNA